MNKIKRPVVLVIRDGWGENHDPSLDKYNAIKLANIPFCRELSANWPRTEIAACGLSVGLPEGIMGNSEVGHQNIGAGRIVDQEIVRIDKGFSSGSVLESPALKGVFQALDKGGSLHIFGLCSDAGVHSMLRHLYSLLQICADKKYEKVYLHAFTDGRDTPPTSGLGFIKQVEEEMKKRGVGRVVSVIGRFWAMDRDKRWNRVQKAYDCLVGKKAAAAVSNPEDAFKNYYANPAADNMVGDEFIPPTWVEENGGPVGRIKDGDAVIFFNFRGDRPREITRAFIDAGFNDFDRGEKLDVFFATMTEYQVGLCPNILFPKPPKMKNILGEYVSNLGLAQLRCAETEKFAHVTFFFNDYRDEPFKGEDRILIDSPRDVQTYDQKPEMSEPAVAKAAAEAIRSNKYALVIINFANPDMVGHTGNLAAAVKACEAVDSGVKEIAEAVDEVGAAMLVTADHGNSDQLFEPASNTPHTRHTLNPVEVVIYGKDLKGLKLRSGGCLGDIAPTLLELLGFKKPDEMTGSSLIEK
ncbi:MAG: 2,3-bisphosphoglycerate-independent phosphoglycerate mutase [Opitutales bacterium]|nr:2,3-bisphosphoglycerate-independent phosphoglycerate mutase [Opitutales bacterium]